MCFSCFGKLKLASASYKPRATEEKIPESSNEEPAESPTTIQMDVNLCTEGNPSNEFFNEFVV